MSKHEKLERKLLQGIDPERYHKYRLAWAVAATLVAEKKMHGDDSPLTEREFCAAMYGCSLEQIESAVAHLFA